MPILKLQIKLIIQYTIAESAKVLWYMPPLPSSAPGTPNRKGQICAHAMRDIFLGRQPSAAVDASQLPPMTARVNPLV